MKTLHLFTNKKHIKLFRVLGIVLVVLLATSTQAWAATENFNSGAYIIDMGTSSQTYATGLKPYGLVYDLIVNENVPVRWAIDPNKQKDQADFSADGKSYKGGSFIVPVEYLSSDVLAVLNSWENQGVIVDGPISNGFSAPIYKSLTSWPRAILDEANGKIVKEYYTNAGVPSSSYILAGDPTDLTSCGDIYVLPHADPQLWDDSWGQALYNFVVNDQGYLWAACHAVSALETLVDLNSGDRTNFLSDTQLMPWKDIDGLTKHSAGTPPYTYDDSYSGDPIMQFMGALDAATTNGSEQIYVPFTDMSWRSSTKNAVYDPDHPDNPTSDFASVLTYGYAFGNPNYGMVMYEAGHDHDKASNPPNVAAQRAYFNFVLMAGADKEISVNTNIPEFVASGSSISISANGSEGNDPYTYEWSSSCEGGSFDNSNSASTTYTAPVTGSDVTCVITVQVTDDCGRFVFESSAVVVGPADGPEAIDDAATTPINTPVDINVIDNDNEGDAALDPTSIEFIGGTEPNPSTQGSFTVNSTTGLVTFTPVNGFTGTVTIAYKVSDLNSLSDVAIITVEITQVSADLQIVKTANPNPVSAGETLTYTLTVTNNGPDAAENAKVVDILPAGITFVSSNPNKGSWSAPNWNIGDLANGASAQMTIVTTVDNNTSGTISNTATVSSDTEDPDSSNDSSTKDVEVGDSPNIENNFAGTLAFEDLWPGKGDYDFNDLVLDYNFKTTSDQDNYVVKVEASFIIKAFGAGLENGFGFQLPSTINQADITVSGYSLNESYITLNSNGTEDGQSLPTIIVFDNAYKEMLHPGIGIGVNTDPNAPYVSPKTINILITFPAETYKINDLNIANFNPFLIANLTRGHEVHLPDYAPTDLMDTSLFATFDDDSNPGSNKYFKTSSNLPWAINIFESFDYPIEKRVINSAFLHFIEWAESGGSLYDDWYKDKPGYRNTSNIYKDN